jgi:hypothetical protein
MVAASFLSRWREDACTVHCSNSPGAATKGKRIKPKSYLTSEAQMGIRTILIIIWLVVSTPNQPTDRPNDQPKYFSQLGTSIKRILTIYFLKTLTSNPFL